MSDLIRRQEAIDEFWKSEMAFRPSQIDEVMRILCKVPTIDAVPVVRCKDCREFSDDDAEDGWGFCNNTGVGMERDGFCSCGERKDDGT